MISILGVAYGDLIDIFEQCDSESPGNKEHLYTKFKSCYPDIYIGRSDRFYQTVLRIVAPTRPSLRGDSSIKGANLLSYRKKTWVPRIRNFQGTCTYT